jgi:hypothetical protein
MGEGIHLQKKALLADFAVYTPAELSFQVISMGWFFDNNSPPYTPTRYASVS